MTVGELMAVLSHRPLDEEVYVTYGAKEDGFVALTCSFEEVRKKHERGTIVDLCKVVRHHRNDDLTQYSDVFSATIITTR